MSKKIKKNYALKAPENQLTIENIKNINDTLLNESASRKNESASLSSQIANTLSQLLNLKNDVIILETTINNINFYKETFILDSTDILNGYIDVQNKAKNDSMRIEMGCFVLQENVDYTLSTVNNKTRITFINNNMPQFFEINDKLFVQYYSI